MWVNRMLNPLCDLELWPWPWIFKVKFYMDWKGCESIGSWADPLCYFQLWPHLSPWPWLFKVKFLKSCTYLRNGRVNWYGMKGTWVYKMLNPLCDLELWSWPWTSNCEQPYFKNWTGDWHGTKGMSGFLEPLWPWLLTLPMTLDWIFKVKFWNDHISRMEGSIDERDVNLVWYWTHCATLDLQYGVACGLQHILDTLAK